MKPKPKPEPKPMRRFLGEPQAEFMKRKAHAEKWAAPSFREEGRREVT
jgi:hypothetical protein